MKLKLNYECFDKGLEKLSQEYKIFAPVVLEYKGTYSDTPSIRYKEVKKFEDMEFDKDVIRKHAESFDESIFKQKINSYINTCYGEFKNQKKWKVINEVNNDNI